MKWTKGKNSGLGSPKNRPNHLPPGREFPVLPLNCFSAKHPELVKALGRIKGESFTGLMVSPDILLSGFYFGGPKYNFYDLGARVPNTAFSIHSQNHWQISWRKRTADHPSLKKPLIKAPLAQALEWKRKRKPRSLRVQAIGMTKDFGLFLLLSSGWTIEIYGLRKGYAETWRLMLPDDEDRGLHWVIEEKSPWSGTGRTYGPAQDYPVTHIRPQRRPKVRFIGHMKPSP